jgi:hypothetical protein
MQVDEDAVRTKARTRGRELASTLCGLSGDKSGTAMRATQETRRRARLAANNVQVTSSGVLDIMRRMVIDVRDPAHATDALV